MKVYFIIDNRFGSYNAVHSAYTSKKKAQSKSKQLRREDYLMSIEDYIANEEVSREEAIEFVNGDFPRWLYKVMEIEVEE
jgi:hypothetical protein